MQHQSVLAEHVTRGGSMLVSSGVDRQGSTTSEAKPGGSLFQGLARQEPCGSAFPGRAWERVHGRQNYMRPFNIPCQ